MNDLNHSASILVIEWRGPLEFLVLEKSSSYQMPGWVVGPGMVAQAQGVWPGCVWSSVMAEAPGELRGSPMGRTSSKRLF